VHLPGLLFQRRGTSPEAPYGRSIESVSDPLEQTIRLVTRAREGDADSFAQLYERVAPAVHTWAELRIRPSQRNVLEPTDLVQEVWLRAWRGLEGLDIETVPFRPWIFRIAKNVLLEGLRRAQTRDGGPAAGSSTRQFAVANVPDAVTAVSRRLVRDESIQAFTEEVRELEADDQKLVTHCGLEGLPYAEVGTRLGLSTDAVAKRWRRLRAKLSERGLPDILVLETPG